MKDRILVAHKAAEHSTEIPENPELLQLRVDLVDVLEHAKQSKDAGLVQQLRIFVDRLTSEVYIAEQDICHKA